MDLCWSREISVFNQLIFAFNMLSPSSIAFWYAFGVLVIKNSSADYNYGYGRLVQSQKKFINFELLRSVIQRYSEK